MKLTRRQGLLALGAGLGAVLLKASPLARLRSIPGFGPGGGNDVDRHARREPSLLVQPDPHSVKRHA